MSRPVVLIGFMGAGKTTIGRELDAEALDADREIERRAGAPIPEIFAREGEDGFRRLEEEVVLGLLDRARSQPGRDLPGPVISLGGGAVLSEAVRRALAHCLVVWIDVDLDTAWRRSGSGEGDRPLARDRDRFEALFEERRGLYEDLADVVLPGRYMEGLGSAARDREAGRLRAAIDTAARLPAGSRLLWAIAGGRGRPVFVGSGLIAGPEGFALPGTDRDRAGAADWPGPGRGFLVTDERVREVVDGLRRERGLTALGEGETAGLYAIPPGEEAKTLANVERVAEAMAAAGVTRADHVAALGGGVVGDLAGFCAAVYQRGIPVVQVPTTVVAQVDSAYGGKTGVDLPAAKNYVGAYHQPAAVITDPSLLTTLPAAELAAGYVEMLKTGLLAGGRLWRAACEIEPGSARALADHPFAIFDCARFKCAVVADDERDGGLRQILNLGHTVGHAIEAATGYAAYRHGEAVALGLLAALRLSGADELRGRVAEILAAWGLPLAIDSDHCARAMGRSVTGDGEITPERIFELTRRDKKRLGERTPFVLLAEPGEPRYGQEVPDDEVRAAIEELFEGDG